MGPSIPPPPPQKKKKEKKRKGFSEVNVTE